MCDQAEADNRVTSFQALAGFGNVDPADVRIVDLDPDQLMARGLSPTDVSDAINAQNLVERVETKVSNPLYGDMALEAVYSVSFRSEDLFGPSDEGDWTVLLDLTESYLEPA